MEQGQSLKSIFGDAENKRKLLDGISDRNSLEHQNTLIAAIRLYRDASKLADSLSIFSLNETIDDISTNDLQYETHIYTHIHTHTPPDNLVMP